MVLGGQSRQDTITVVQTGGDEGSVSVTECVSEGRICEMFEVKEGGFGFVLDVGQGESGVQDDVMRK